MSDITSYTFYFCDLKSSDETCPKSDTCKRWQIIKDLPFDAYTNIPTAKLYNICNNQNYKMYMENK